LRTVAPAPFVRTVVAAPQVVKTISPLPHFRAGPSAYTYDHRSY
jgi:hypothetical protein